jgi:hypothetical protein
MAVVVGNWSVEPAGAGPQPDTAPQEAAPSAPKKHNVAKSLRHMKARASRVRAH